MDLAGKKNRLASAVMDRWDGYAWSPRGDELWFASRPESGDGSVLRAVDRNASIACELMRILSAHSTRCARRVRL